jgi:hypothetical protein
MRLNNGFADNEFVIITIVTQSNGSVVAAHGLKKLEQLLSTLNGKH